MPIITKPSSIQKNQSAQFVLNKTELSQLPSILADTYFSDTSNWKEVILSYKSTTGNQNQILKFDATLSSPSYNLLVSEKAKDLFQVQRITIVDFDNGSIKIPRSQLTVSDFDISF